MCGIAGIFQLKHTETIESIKESNEKRIRSMLGMLQHRGPDANGLYLDDYVALGHSRLAIIDLQSGNQPMVSGNGRYWISFNGEIYNYLELKQELMVAGIDFKTSSDTEVIVNAYQHWGESCFTRFNGQWALAIWDTWEKELLLSRDQIGICPLYFFKDDNRLCFASEIKALFALPGIPREFCVHGISQLLTTWGPLAPNTVYKNIFELQPGHLAFFRGNESRQKRYWQLTFNGSWRDQQCALGDAVEQMKAQLESATRLRFTRSDVPVGAYLSGGIDSSITSYLVKQFTDAPVDTYSLRFDDTEFDEGSFQQQVASDLGTRHHEVSVSKAMIAESFPETLFHAERPVLRTAPVPMFLLSRLVRGDDKKVVVTGEGADEMLAGYDLFREAKVRRFIGRVPDSKIRGKLVEKLYPWMQRNPGQAPAFAKSFFLQDLDLNDPGLSHRPRWNASGALLQFVPDSISGTEQEVFEQLPDNWQSWHPLELSQWLEITTLLPSYLISAQGDRMLMANSVEGRFPFLDINLIEFSATLNPRYKLWGLHEKYILKRAYNDKLPSRVINRPKQPYRAPDADVFFSGEKPEWLREIMRGSSLDKIEIIDGTKVKKLFAKGEKFGARKMGNTDNMRIVSMMSLAILQQQFIEGQAIQPKDIQFDVFVDGNLRGGAHC